MKPSDLHRERAPGRLREERRSSRQLGPHASPGATHRRPRREDRLQTGNTPSTTKSIRSLTKSQSKKRSMLRVRQNRQI